MRENVPVRCPGCGSAHMFAAPVYPCPCGSPVAAPLLRGAPATRITHRSWADEWVTVRCTGCGRHNEWPQPELGCHCGTVLRIPVRSVTADIASGMAAGTAPGAGERPAPDRAVPPRPVERRVERPVEWRVERPAECPTHIPLPRTAASPRPSFQPVAIRTAQDAVTAAALYLRWLGFRDVVRSDRPASGIDLRGPDLIAQVDPSTSPSDARAIECLWLYGLKASAVGVFFSLAGYADEARARADHLGVPLFVMDLTGTPQPVNGPADELNSSGA